MFNSDEKEYIETLTRIIQLFPDPALEAQIAFQKKTTILRKQKKEDNYLINELKKDERIKNGNWDDETLNSKLSQFMKPHTQVMDKAQKVPEKMSFIKLIIWDEEASVLIRDFESEVNNNVIKTKSQWGSFDFNSEEYDVIIILAELNWGAPPYLQDFYGIEVAKSLRKNNFHQPIIFVSSISQEIIYKNDKKRYIINTIGHKVIGLHKGKLSWETMESEMILTLKNRNKIPLLNEEELSYIKMLYCEEEGIIRTIIHDMRKLIAASDIKDKIVKSLEQIYSVYNENSSAAIKTFNAKFNKINEKNLKNAFSYIEEIGELLISNYNNFDGSKTKDIKEDWSVLLLDDEITSKKSDIDKLCETLELKVKQVYRATNAVDASIILQSDFVNENNIRVVIADYHLQNKQGTLATDQEIQGFSFLKRIVQSGRIYGLIGLSGLPRRFLMKTFKVGNIDVFYKGDYLQNNDSIGLLSEEILQLGNEVEQTIYSLPNNQNWELFYKSKYIEHRNSVGYRRRERSISERSNFWIEKYQEQIENEYLLAGLGSKKVKKSFENFELACSSRRIALWLSQKGKNKVGLPLTTYEIAELLKGNVSEEMAKQVTSVHLALRLDDFPTNMTVEEKNWFHFQMNVPIYIELNLLKESFNNLSIIIQKYINSTEQDLGIKDKIRNNKLEVSYKGVDTFTVIFDGDFKPYIRAYTDLLILTHSIFPKDFNDFTESKLHIFRSLARELRMQLENSEGKLMFPASDILRKFYTNHIGKILGILNKLIDPPTEEEGERLDKIFSMLRQNSYPSWDSPYLNEYTDALIFINDNNIDIRSVDKEFFINEFRKNMSKIESYEKQRDIREGMSLEQHEKIRAAKAKKQGGSNLLSDED
ncbi:MAG: hypothetical protein K8S00_13065 [Bacteroidales bacterium]|nr:hypothetical protein [Bacteroidales bacterium]